MKCACKTYPEFLTVEQVANVLAASIQTVNRQFGHLKGVLDLGARETMHRRRRRKLRIPRTTLDAYLRQKQVKPRR